MNSKHWESVKNSLNLTEKRKWVETLFVTVPLPILEAALVNLLTSAPSGQRLVIGVVLGIVALFHLCLAGLVLYGEDVSPMKASANALEIESELQEARKELQRRSKCYTMVRTAIDAFNNTTCTLEPWCKDGFEKGLDPIIHSITCDCGTTLGVTSNAFTIEVFCLPSEVVHYDECFASDIPLSDVNLKLVYFYSPQSNDRFATIALGQSSPASLGMSLGVPVTHHISDEPSVFMPDQKPLPLLYFRRYATVPINLVCMPEFMGVLVLTSKQDEPFADDVLDTLQFLSSIISHYVQSYNQCVFTRKQSDEKERRKIIRQQKKLYGEMPPTLTPAPITAPTPPPIEFDGDDPDDQP